MVEDEGTQKRRARWAAAALEVLGECGCHDMFKVRNLFDPTCMLHQCETALTEALNMEYNQGRADMRKEWLAQAQQRHGGR